MVLVSFVFFFFEKATQGHFPTMQIDPLGISLSMGAEALLLVHPGGVHAEFQNKCLLPIIAHA